MTAAWRIGTRPSALAVAQTGTVAERLRAAGHRVEVLDGDEIRAELTADLGFSRDDRIANVRRIGFVAATLVVLLFLVLGKFF